jgi:aryl-alcohol dehydrogenase-like predicted oxidoreductase
MDTRTIGSLAVTIVGVGCNNFGNRIDEQQSREVIDAAIDAGLNFFDTADMYGNGRSEEILGRALGPRRSDVIIASKFGQPMPDGGRGARPGYVRRACEASLKRLGTDYIDLYQQHVPDPDVPIEETLGALDELVLAGVVKEIGCSNFSAPQIGEADEASRKHGFKRFVSVQNEYSLLHREPEGGVLEECKKREMAFLPFFPLKSGLLTGKYRRSMPVPEGTRIAKSDHYRALLTDENLEKVEALTGYAESRGISLLDLAFSWLLAHPTVASVIAGASSGAQVRANASAPSLQLSSSDLKEVDELLRAAV